MKVIFLDFDGVLNSEQYEQGPDYMSPTGLPFGESRIDPKCIQRVNHLIDSTGAKVVLSTAWRHMWSRDEIVDMLEKRGFKHASSVLDILPSLNDSRGEEVKQWLGQSEEGARIGGEGVDGYVILDDVPEFDGEQMQHFIQTNPDVGLTDQDVRRAISILGI
jgi:hypothetical protein